MNNLTIQQISEDAAIEYLKEETSFVTIPDLAYKILTKHNINNEANRKLIYGDLYRALTELVKKKRVKEYYGRMSPKYFHYSQARYKGYKLI